MITPNLEELGLFCKGKLAQNDMHARIGAAIKLSRMLNSNVLLKGHEGIITDGRRVKVAKSNSSALATMGTGDVLAGMIGAYAAQNKDMFVAVVAASYLHKRIGDRLHKEEGNHILATDIVDAIPRALRRFDREG